MVLPRNHNQNLEVSCIYCLNKFKTGKNTKSPLKLENISVGIKAKIVEHFYPEFYENQNLLPQKVCSGCFKKLTLLGTKNERKMEEPLDYPTLVASALSVPPERRSEIGYKCYCNICNYASLQHAKHGNAPLTNPIPSTSASGGPSRPPPPRPPPPARPPPPRIPTSPSQQISVELPQPSPSSPPSSPPPVGVIGPSTPKKKASIFDGMNNTQIWNELQKLPTSMREMVATDILDDYIKKAKASGQPSFKLCRKLGPKFEYHIVEKADGKFIIGVDVLNSLSTQLGLSGRQTLKAKNILQDYGAPVQTGVREELYAFYKKANNFFEAREMLFQCDPIDGQERGEDYEEGNNLRVAICCNDVPGYIKFMQEQRQLDEDITLRVGMDGGKVTLCSTYIEISELSQIL